MILLGPPKDRAPAQTTPMIFYDEANPVSAADTSNNSSQDFESRSTPQSRKGTGPKGSEDGLVFGQSCPFDSVTPQKAQLRAEIFNNEIMEALYEPDDDELSDDEAVIAY